MPKRSSKRRVSAQAKAGLQLARQTLRAIMAKKKCSTMEALVVASKGAPASAVALLAAAAVDLTLVSDEELDEDDE